MGKDKKKTRSNFHRDQTKVSWFHLGGTKFWGQVYGGRKVNFLNSWKTKKKTPMGKDQKKTHSTFHCEHTNLSWFKIGGTNFRSPVYGERWAEFLENSKKPL